VSLGYPLSVFNKNSTLEGLRCVLYFPPRAGGGVRIFGFHNNNKKINYGHPLSVSSFNLKLYSQTKCQNDSGKKCNLCFNLCVCICECRYVPHTPCKLQRWSSALTYSSRNALINPIPIHGFRHRGCLRAHPRCCLPFIVCWLIPIKNGWDFKQLEFLDFFCQEFRILEPKMFFFRKNIRYVA